MRHVAATVYAVTTGHLGNRFGILATAVSSLSFDPPSLLVCVNRTASLHAPLAEAQCFCVNVLAADQEHVSAQMASKGTDKFAGIDFTPAAATGSPVIDGTLAHLDCTVHAVHEGGDHYVVIGRVQDMDFAADANGASPEPLLFFQGAYRTVR